MQVGGIGPCIRSATVGFMPMHVIGIGSGMIGAAGLGMITAISAATNSCLRVIVGQFSERDQPQAWIDTLLAWS
jgi:hypothetical protein